jgi:glycosyltransferase involved in cell wall biosynthesis
VLRLAAVANTAQSACFGSADHIISVSERLKTYIEATGIAPRRVTCLPNGVDTIRFNPSTDALPIRSRYALGSRPIIGFIGSLKPWHGLDFLFDAVGLIGKWRADHALMVVGDGPGFAYARERAEKEDLVGRIILAGKVPHDEIPSYLAAMNVTVAPYQPEKDFYFSPLKVLESLAAGRPVVAPRQGQLTDLIEDGVTGLLYEPGDLNAFARGVETLLADPKRQESMSRSARRFATANLSWDSVARRSVAIMTEALQTA